MSTTKESPSWWVKLCDVTIWKMFVTWQTLPSQPSQLSTVLTELVVVVRHVLMSLPGEESIFARVAVQSKITQLLTDLFVVGFIFVTLLSYVVGHWLGLLKCKCQWSNVYNFQTDSSGLCHVFRRDFILWGDRVRRPSRGTSPIGMTCKFP